MATPTLTKHSLAGSLGEILVDVRAGGRESPRPAIVVIHGFKGFKDWGMFPPLAERLARAGFATVMTFNVSGSGVDDAGELVLPERFGHNTYSAELDDLGRVVDALAAGGLGVAPPTALGMVGHSRGGGIAILQAARDPRVRALVTWSAISSVERSVPAAGRRMAGEGVAGDRERPHRPAAAALHRHARRHRSERRRLARHCRGGSRLHIPWLIIHGAEDESVSPLEAEALRAASTLPGTRRLDDRGRRAHLRGRAPVGSGKHDTPELAAGLRHDARPGSRPIWAERT